MTRHGWLYWLNRGSLVVAVLVLAVIAGCTPEEAKSIPEASQGSLLEETAARVVEGYGTVLAVHEEGEGIPVFVFQEMHSSVIQQAEIAVMLVRLYGDFGLRTIGLEGACLGFFDVPQEMRGRYQAGSPITISEDVAVQLLANGELGSAEMMAAIYGDVNVLPVDDGKMYSIEESLQSHLTKLIYLRAIADSYLPEEERGSLPAPDTEEYYATLIDVIDSNMAARDLKNAYLNADSGDASQFYNQIIDLAVERGLTDRDEAETHFAEAFAFDRAAYDRGIFMAEQMGGRIAGYAASRDETVLALTCGAAHAEVSETLRESGIPHVVIRPRGYDLESDPTLLTVEQVQRKNNALPVILSPVLSEALVGSRKFPPAIDKVWCQAEYEICLLATRLAREASGGNIPPFDEAMLVDLLPLRCTSVIPQSVFVDAGEVVFGINTLDRTGEETQLWVRALVDRPLTEQTLEERLSELIEDMYAGIEGQRTCETTSAIVIVPVSADTVAAFFDTEAAARNTRMSE